MKAIESIKAQVSAAVVFNAKTFDELHEQIKNASERILAACDRMKAAEVFTDGEITEIRQYAFELRDRRSNECWRDIRAAIRGNFEF